MTSLETRRATLTARLQELDARIHEIEEELDAHNSPDWDDRAIERETDEVLEGMGLTSQAEMAMIRAALTRMDNDEYGACVSCGVDISEARLDILPFTPFCRNCANKGETDGR